MGATRGKNVFGTVVILSLAVALGLFGGCEGLATSLEQGGTGTSGSETQDVGNLTFAPDEGSATDRTTMNARWDYQLTPPKRLRWRSFIGDARYCSGGDTCEEQGVLLTGRGTVNMEVRADDVAEEHGLGTFEYRVRVFDEEDETVGELSTSITIIE